VSPEKPVAMTLKLPHDMCVRLKTVAAEKNSKGQTIMLDAVREYLDRTA
jgi:predicted transcriptional regulator